MSTQVPYICSLSEYYDIMALLHPENPRWAALAQERHREFMKRTMKEGRWPWSRGPKGRLP